ncbi:MAG: hypothetical protein ACRD2Z_09075 [Thermoanaerobaculia bacterium]
MDTFSHGIWGWVVLRRRGASLARWGVLAGAGPDLAFFLPSLVERIIQRGWSGAFAGRDPGIWRADGPPLPAELVEAYHRYYVWTHSLVILGLVTLAVWLLGRRRWCWLAVPWGLHILMDLPTHERYLTRPFFPLSQWTVHGLAWTDPRILWPHLAILVAAVVWTWRATYNRSP